MKPGEKATDAPNENVPRRSHAPDRPLRGAGETDLLGDASSIAESEESAEEDFSDCLNLIDRVRRSDPDCLAGLGAELSIQPAGDGPHQIGRFQIRRQIGEGGFGLVFLALDPELEREVALKVPRVDALLTQQTRERFLREAKAVAALHHPNIATIYESGQIGPICYIAAAYYSGGSLADRVSPSSPLPPTEAARCMATLAHAVQHAHSRGILHRDLKPANVLLGGKSRSGDDSDDQVDTSEARRGVGEDLFITDFGLAKVIGDPTHQTQTGALLGTPAYMSPEQADSRLDEISIASDIYALGAIFYFLLTGRPPFEEASTLAVLESVRTAEPASPRKFSATIPRDLEAICLKCLEKQPARRYETAAELVADLERFLAGESVQARSINTVQRVARWCARNPVAAALAAAFTASLLALATVSTMGYWRTSRALDQRNAALQEVNERKKQAEERLHLAQQAVGDFLVATADEEQLKSGALHRLRRDLLTRAQAFFQKLVATEDGDKRELQSAYGLAVWRLGVLNRQLGEYPEAERAHLQSIRIFERLVEQQPDDVAVLNRLGRCYLDLGLLYFRQNDRQGAEPYWRKAAELYDGVHTSRADLSSAVESVLQNSSTAVECLGMLHAMDQQFDDAERCYEQARAIRLELAEKFSEAPDNHGFLANSHTNLGYLDKSRGDAEAAAAHFQAAVEILQGALLDHPRDERLRMDLAKDLQLLAEMLKQQRDRAGAHGRLDQAVKILTQLCEDQPLTPLYRIRLAMLCSDLSIDPQRAVEERFRHRERARELVEEVRRRHPQQRIDYMLPYSLHMNTAVDLRKNGQSEKADEELMLAIEVCDGELERDPENDRVRVNRAKAEYCLGHHHARDEDPTIALNAFTQAANDLEPILRRAPDLAKARRWLGLTYRDRAALRARLDQEDKAHQDRLRAAELGQEVEHEDPVYALTRELSASPENVKLLLKRGWRWYQRGDYAAAIEDATRAIAIQPERVNAWQLRGWSHMNAYQFKDAAVNLEKAVALSEEPDGWTLRDLAWIYAVADHPVRNADRAADLAEQALRAADADDERLICLSTLGVARYQQGRYQQALDVIARMESTRPHFESLYYQARCHHALGDATAAANCYTSAGDWRQGDYERFAGELVDMEPYLETLEATVAKQLGR